MMITKIVCYTIAFGVIDLFIDGYMTLKTTRTRQTQAKPGVPRENPDAADLRETSHDPTILAHVPSAGHSPRRIPHITIQLIHSSGGVALDSNKW